jgi:cytochrome c oxidase cbb3-type subunit 3
VRMESAKVRACESAKVETPRGRRLPARSAHLRTFAPSHLRTLLTAVALAASLTACEREQRRFRETPPSATPGSEVQTSGGFVAGPPLPEVTASTPYLNNAYAVNEGKSLYLQMNCVGCHFHGGGGIGPPLMDERWIYGSQPENIYQSIEQGRPNGMPAWGSRLSSDQMWKLTAYVMSMSGQVRKDVAPGRDDHMQGKKQEQGTEVRRPRNYGGQPPSTVFP